MISLKVDKAQSSDGIPTEVIREVAKKRPQILLDIYDECLAERIISEKWKRAKLVLIDKGKEDPDSASAERPLSLLHMLGKTYKLLLESRFSSAIQELGNLAVNQHGVRMKWSTVVVIRNIVDIFHLMSFF